MTIIALVFLFGLSLNVLLTWTLHLRLGARLSPAPSNAPAVPVHLVDQAAEVGELLAPARRLAEDMGRTAVEVGELLTEARGMVEDMHRAAAAVDRLLASERQTSELGRAPASAPALPSLAADDDDDEAERTKVAELPRGVLKLLRSPAVQITPEEHALLEALGRLEKAGDFRMDTVADISQVRQVERMGAARTPAERLAIVDRITAQVLGGELRLPDLRTLRSTLAARLLGASVDMSDPDARAAALPEPAGAA
jgi:hypothetical protein